jgi:hypothetical protein
MNFTGKIVITRYGGIFRGLKVCNWSSNYPSKVQTLNGV